LIATNTPTLRFGEFDEEWSEKRYGDIYSFYTTNSYSRDNLNYEKGTVRNIHYGDIHTKFSTMFYLEKEKVPFINEDIELNKIKDESYCQVGDLVIADASEDYADIGKTMEIMSLNNEKTLAGLHTFLARPRKHDMVLGYTGYLLQSWKIRKQIMRIAQGTKVLSLSTKRLAHVILHIPTKPEQQKIATFLSAVDSSIEQLSKKEQLLRSYKKGVMQKIFSREIRFTLTPSTSSGNGETEKSVTEPVEVDDGGVFEDWVEKRLGDVLKIGSGKDYKHLKSGDIPVYGTGGYMTSVDSCLFDGKSVCIGRKGTINKPVLLDGKFWTVDTLFYTHSYNGLLVEYFYHLALTINWLKYNEGTTLPSLSKKTIENIKINLPSLPEQTKIANFLSSLDKQIAQVSEQLAKKKAFKKELLQQMFV